eukprot:2997745-Rhodomonas_salina.1
MQLLRFHFAAARSTAGSCDLALFVPETDLIWPRAAQPLRAAALPSALQVSPAIRLRAAYAMSGTDLAYGAVSLRSCYAMSGTDLPHALPSPYARAMRCPSVCSTITLRACYAMSGTDIAYGATRLPRRGSSPSQ